MKNADKNFNEVVTETLEGLSVNPYREYSVESLNAEVEVAVMMIDKYKKPLNRELLGKYNTQLLDASAVLDTYELIDEIKVDLEAVNKKLFAKNAYRALIEVANMFDIPVSLKDKSVEAVVDAANDTVNFAKSVVRGTLDFGIDLVKDTLSIGTAIIGGATSGAINGAKAVTQQKEA